MHLPWHEVQTQQILTCLRQDRLPQGLILHGPEGLGQLDFALELSALLLCQTPKENHACGECPACALWVSENHPDFCYITPEKEGGSIGVERIRAVNTTLAHSHFADQYRVVLIAPAGAMNESAQNALLKNLEEPPAKTLFILVCTELGRLKPTVMSRCQKMAFTPVFDHAPTEAYLKERYPQQNPKQLLLQAQGAPLRCAIWSDPDYIARWTLLTEQLHGLQNDKDSLVAVAKALNAIDLSQLIAWFISVCEDALYRLFGAPGIALQHPDLATLLDARIMKPSQYSDLLTWLMDIRHKARHNLNSQLVIEDLLIRWRDNA